MPVFAALTVNTNISALNAQNNLSRSSGRLNISLQRLSTGLRINSSADDPSGLVISEFQRAQIAGLQAAISNVDRAISLVQTAEGGLAEINALLIELRSLVTDSANNGALDIPSLEANQANVDNLLATIDRIAQSTIFGTFNLLNGEAGLNGFTNSDNITFLQASDPAAVPANTTPVLAIDITMAGNRAVAPGMEMGTTARGITQTQSLGQAETLIINGVEIELTADLNQAAVIETINNFTGQTGVVAVIDANVGTVMGGNGISLHSVLFGEEATIDVVSTINPVTTTLSTGIGTQLNLMGADVEGTIGGAAATGRGNVLTGDPGGVASGVSIEVGLVANSFSTTVAGAQGDLVLVDSSRSFQIGPFADRPGEPVQNRATVTFFKSDTVALGIGVLNNQFANLNQIDIRRVDGANDALAILERAIGEVSTQRGTIGAFQANTLETTQSNLRTQLINLQDAESSLRDTDFTTEITMFTSEQIRQQASTTVLGLANQSALAILGLLQGSQ